MPKSVQETISKTLATILKENATRRVFESAATAWSDRDLERLLKMASVDVTRSLNVDGDRVPFAASTHGKSALRRKLQLMLDTFEFSAYVTDHLEIKGNTAQAQMKIIFTHRPSGEQLITGFRIVVEVHDNLITSIEEYHDARYLEAFTRMVSQMTTLHVKSGTQ